LFDKKVPIVGIFFRVFSNRWNFFFQSLENLPTIGNFFFQPLEDLPTIGNFLFSCLFAVFMALFYFYSVRTVWKKDS